MGSESITHESASSAIDSEAIKGERNYCLVKSNWLVKNIANKKILAS